ncbi:S8 family serine peptidase [bacterium]|nr:S8 family serine peptidase [bacterium]
MQANYSTVRGSGPKIPYVSGEVLIQVRPQFGVHSELADGLAIRSSIADEYSMELLDSAPLGLHRGASQILRLQLAPGQTLEQAVQLLSQDERVMCAAPNTVYHADIQPNDMDPRLYGLAKIQAPEAWNKIQGSRSGPVVAVLDSGVDYQHPDLKENIWVNPKEVPGNGRDDDGNGVVDDVHGYNASKDNGDPMSGDNHGTHCAGTIGAVGNNGLGVVGVNWQAQVMPINIFGGFGADTMSMVKALNYASQMGARIASCSFGGGVYNPILYEAFSKSPMLHICAAGNHAKDVNLQPHYPACFDLPNIVSVAATDDRDQLAKFSNYGSPRVDLAAPGQAILSTVPGGYAELSGTSMATPHVSGAAALIASQFPEASPSEIRTRLLANVDVIPGLQGKVITSGRLNVLRALEQDTTPPGAPAALKGTSKPHRVDLSWTASGDDQSKGTASFFELDYSLDGKTVRDLSFTPPRPGASGTGHKATLELLPSARTRSLECRLRALDNVGQSSPVTTVQVQVPAAKVALEASAEDPSAWKAEGYWAPAQLPERGTIWSDSPQGDHAHKLDMSLTGPAFSLKGHRGSKLMFEALYSFEKAEEKDVLHIEASSDAGKNWAVLQSLRGDSPWKIHEVDLSRFDGKPQVQFRFRLKTDNTGVRDGMSLGRCVVASDLPKGKESAESKPQILDPKPQAVALRQSPAIR